ncbi:P-II family nitrogen regulator [Calorimonas adulescens]|jgi:hypothetical protein|uniref:P-II family nitrogen regulator n=1 Tax=Calorimonas adulescens TaxID=2606906 RepID=A0A5D8Q947_9THEO|nr:hypothetical protein [Calorimonas adulescens]TZE81295.1 hypothetical protein FWJ32_09690 [Calorimonas adulescens]
MYLFVVVLNRVEYLDKLLITMREHGAKGATVLDSVGSGRIIKNFDEARPMIASIRRLREEEFSTNKTIFSVLETRSQVDEIADAIEKAIGNFSDKEMGIMFSIPLDMVRGGALERYIRSKGHFE